MKAAMNLCLKTSSVVRSERMREWVSKVQSDDHDVKGWLRDKTSENLGNWKGYN